MELRLQKFVESMQNLSDIRNLDTLNPVVVQLEHPVTATRFTTIAAIEEPSYLGIPIYTTWIVLDPNSPYYRRALKLHDFQPPTAENGGIVGFNATWIEITTYDAIFEPAQYYQGLRGDKGDKGDKGDPGPAGPQGDKGADAVVDYEAIINEVIRRMQPDAATLRIIGPSSVLEGQTGQYTVELVRGTTVTPLLVQISAPAGSPVSINAQNLLTAGNVSADTNVQLTVTFDDNGTLLTATKDIIITNAVLQSLTINGSASVNEGTNSTYTATATYSNGATALVSATFSISSGTAASITAGGVLTANQVSSASPVTISASFTENGVTKTATKTISVADVPQGIAPYYGTALDSAPINEALVLGLANRGPAYNRLNPSFTIDSGMPGSGLTQIYAYPKSYGLATFTDLSNGFQGGWDGALGDPTDMSKLGPAEVTVNGVVFYVYKTDWPSIGAVTWSVT